MKTHCNSNHLLCERTDLLKRSFCRDGQTNFKNNSLLLYVARQGSLAAVCHEHSKRSCCKQTQSVSIHLCKKGLKTTTLKSKELLQQKMDYSFYYFNSRCSDFNQISIIRSKEVVVSARLDFEFNKHQVVLIRCLPHKSFNCRAPW